MWLVYQSDSLLLSHAQVAALQPADSIYSARVRAVFVPLGEFLANAHGTAGPAQLDSVLATEKSYWKVFWEQPENADSIITPARLWNEPQAACSLVAVFQNSSELPR